MKKYAIGQQLAKYGRGPDSLLAHITPREAALLKHLGGAGTRNPVTGLLEFLDSGDAGAGAAAAADADQGGEGGTGGDAAGGGGSGRGGGRGGPGGFGRRGPDPFGDVTGIGALGLGLGNVAANPNAVSVDVGPVDLSNNPFGGVIGVSDQDAAKARTRTSLVNRPTTARQIREATLDSLTATQANPNVGALVGALAGMAMPPGLGLAAQAMAEAADPLDSNSAAAEHGGFGDPDSVGGGDDPGGLLSPRQSGGLASTTPDPGLAGFTYTNPLTGQVERYQGGLLPWQTPGFV